MAATDTEFQSSRMRTALRRFKANKMAMIGFVVLVSLVIVAVFGPLVWTYGYTEITPDLSQPPSLAHPLGTDTLGRDMLALVMRGMQQSLSIAGTVALISCLIGTVLGVISAYFGGYVDAGIMRLVDLVLTIPTIALAAFLGNSLSEAGVSWLGLALVLGALLWTSVARLVRGVSLSLRELPFIRAAEVMGAGSIRIMLRHLVPNVADHIIVATALLVGVAILSETGLSFLGFGVQPPRHVAGPFDLERAKRGADSALDVLCAGRADHPDRAVGELCRRRPARRVQSQGGPRQPVGRGAAPGGAGQGDRRGFAEPCRDPRFLGPVRGQVRAGGFER